MPSLSYAVHVSLSSIARRGHLETCGNTAEARYRALPRYDLPFMHGHISLNGLLEHGLVRMLYP